MSFEDENSKPENFNENEYESDETTIEDFLDTIKIEHKEEKKVFIVKPDNSSGMGEGAPVSITKIFNWGAFLFNWIWGIKYQKWILLIALALLFIPYGFIGSFIISLWAGMKGNQWAWEEVQYKNEADFHYAQKKWVKAWFILFGILFVITIALGGILWLTLPKKQLEQISNTNYSIFVSEEKNIPEAVFKNTEPEDQYYDILVSPKISVYWQKENNELSEKNTKYIQDKFEESKELLQDQVELIPADIIQDTEQVETLNSDEGEQESLNCNNGSESCINVWLNQNCKDGYCIINPNLKKYYKVRGKENVIPKVIKSLKSWE